MIGNKRSAFASEEAVMVETRRHEISISLLPTKINTFLKVKRQAILLACFISNANPCFDRGLMFNPPSESRYVATYNYESMILFIHFLG
jgi:hypothetical protein